MQQQRGTLTDRLADVIQVLQLGRKSGLLTVERDAGRNYEEGAITFVNGQISGARTGQITGHDALNRLLLWRTCRFAFTALASANPSLDGAHVSTPPVLSVDTDPTLRRISSIRRGTRPLGEHIPQTHPPPDMPRRQYPSEVALQALEQQGLTRAPRRLFLLIDGTRSFPELVRLMSRSYDEVLVLYQDLARAGLVSQP